MWTHDACGCMAHVEIHRQAHTHGHRPAGLSSVLLPSQAHATRQGGGGPAWKPNKLDPVVPLFFGIFIYILVRLFGLIVSARCSHFSVFPQEAGSEETSLLPQLPPRADCSGWGRGPPVRGPLTPMCIVTQLLHSLPWRFPVFVLCRRKNMGVPLADRWSGLGTVCGPGSVPGPGTKTPPAVRLSQAQTAAARSGARAVPLSEGRLACKAAQCSHRPSACSELQYLRVLGKICEVRCNSCAFCEVFSSERHFKMLQGFPVLEMGLKTML